MQFVRISLNRYINFADIRDISIVPETDHESLSVMVTWRGEDLVDTFTEGEAIAIIEAIKTMAINTNQFAQPA